MLGVVVDGVVVVDCGVVVVVAGFAELPPVAAIAAPPPAATSAPETIARMTLFVLNAASLFARASKQHRLGTA